MFRLRDRYRSFRYHQALRAEARARRRTKHVHNWVTAYWSDAIKIRTCTTCGQSELG